MPSHSETSQSSSLPPGYLEALLVEKALRRRARFQEHAARIGAGERLAKLKAALFAQQRAFVDDPNVTNAALCTARAGKTFSAATMLIEDASDEKNGFDTAYATITLKEAKRIIWNGPSGLKALNRQFDLGLKFNNADLVAITPAGHQILLNGAETEDDIEKLRGQPFRRVVIDEAQSFRAHIDALIQQVLFPRLMDYGGRLSLIGTPGLILAGLFYEVTTGKLPGWSVHKWSLRDNPHVPKVRTAEVPDVEAFLRLVKRRFGWTDETPAYQREFEGRWVRDESTLVYLYSALNVVKALPSGPRWRFIGGIDLGYSDEKTTAFEVVAWSEEWSKAYMIEGFKLPKQSMDAQAAIMKRMQEKYPGIIFVGDPGGLGGQILAEFQLRHGIYVEEAEKIYKNAFIEAMNADLSGAGFDEEQFRKRYPSVPDDVVTELKRILPATTAPRLCVIEGNPILDEWDQIQWKLRRDLKDLRTEDPRFANHCADAGLYAWRKALHFLHRPEEAGPAAGTEEYHRAMGEKMEQEDDDEAQRERDLGWWERD